ncbi:hypothetical protein BRADI_1g62385v3 [Brachypodium distachyon]|uniref:Uncharacterized protein n=1 Tax=Brachypodium distachyon TaxID=15368 RepID=A0A0Q3LFE9_BRADI|nr:hypothetical protein BRADI_1g62385v3 [Brachypodium distachyon]
MLRSPKKQKNGMHARYWWKSTTHGSMTCTHPALSLSSLIHPTISSLPSISFSALLSSFPLTDLLPLPEIQQQQRRPALGGPAAAPSDPPATTPSRIRHGGHRIWPLLSSRARPPPSSSCSSGRGGPWSSSAWRPCTGAPDPARGRIWRPRCEAMPYFLILFLSKLGFLICFVSMSCVCDAASCRFRPAFRPVFF